MRIRRSEALYSRALKALVGGVNSPVRSFKAVGGTPLFIKRARGSRIEDEDGNSYIDYVCSWGALILGSADPQVVSALKRSLNHGTSYGAPTRLETELAEMVTEAFPSIDKLRFVNSGTEATMTALRLARAYTKRKRILKFQGCYHGHVDSLLVSGGSGMATLNIPDSNGIPEVDTLVAPYNDLEYVHKLFERYGEEIAAVIVEPVAANMGVVPAKPEFLQGLHKRTRYHGSLLIFDEVVTGFRVTYGGVQELYNIEPDITCLGKIIGGGLPVGCLGGPSDIMTLLAPEGPVYQAGTLSGNPLAMTAGITTLRLLKRKDPYDMLEKRSRELAEGLLKASEDADCVLRINRIGSMIGLFFTDTYVTDYTSAKSSDPEKYRAFFHKMLARAIYLPPSPFETAFISTAHSPLDISRTVKAAELTFKEIS